MTDSRNWTENRKLEIGVFGFPPLRQVGQPNRDGTDKGAGKLPDKVYQSM